MGAERRVETSRSAYRTWPSVRGIGVAVISRTCGAPRRAFASRAPRCSTPNRCCSSTTARARSSNATASWSRACVPTTTWAWPERIASPARRRASAGRDPVRSVTATPRSSSSPATVSRCWRASRSVGARSAAWRPASAAAARAHAATAVLPDPTSPWMSRSIGTGRARSPRISSSAVAWSGVSAASRPSLRPIAASSDARIRASSAGATSMGAVVDRPRARRRPTMPSCSASSSSNASRRSAASRASNVCG